MHVGDVSLELRVALERLVHLRKIRDAVTASFGPSDAPRARLRNSVVTRLVAAALDREPSPALGRDVLQAMRSVGWRTVRHSNADWWKGITPR